MMQDAMWALMLFTVFAIAAIIVLNNVSRLNHLKKTKFWPSVEATVESGRLEIVHHARFHHLQMPVFEFSYIVDQRPYNGRFGLSMYSEPADSLIAKMVGRKITVQCDPQNPATCFIPGNTIEGCKIEQKIGSQVRFYSKN